MGVTSPLRIAVGALLVAGLAAGVALTLPRVWSSPRGPALRPGPGAGAAREELDRGGERRSSEGAAPERDPSGAARRSADAPAAGLDRGGPPSPAVLAELRASDAFVELAPHERAAEAPLARLAYENFSRIVDGERVEWANNDALWDAIAPALRDEVLVRGPEHWAPLWDAVNPRPTGVTMRWSNESTGGRGQYAEVFATYTGPRGALERRWPLLIATDEAGRGSLVARRTPYEVAERDFSSIVAAHDFTVRTSWAWIQQQPVVAARESR